MRKRVYTSAFEQACRRLKLVREEWEAAGRPSHSPLGDALLEACRTFDSLLFSGAVFEADFGAANPRPVSGAVTPPAKK